MAEHTDMNTDLKHTLVSGDPERYEQLLSINRDLREALEAAKEWLESWASAEPYLSIIDAAIARAKDNTPVLANKEPET